MDIDHTDYTPYTCSEGGHSPIAGMMVVDPEDLDAVARARAARGEGPVECGVCEQAYKNGRWH